MGWCSGTELFDNAANIALSLAKTNRERQNIFYNLIDAFTNQDWDCESESTYWEDPDFQIAYRKVFPDWDQA